MTWLLQDLLYRGLGLASAAPGGFVASVQLPHKTPLHDAVQGEVRGSKQQARTSAALQVVRLLHQAGELDDHLRITRTTRSSKWLKGEFYKSKNTASEGKRKWHQQKPPPPLSVLSGGGAPLHLHRLTLRLVWPHPNPRYRLHHPERDSHCLGLLCSTPLPHLGNMALFTASGQVVAELSYCKELPHPSAEDLDKLVIFHRYLFSTVLSLAPGLQLGPGLPAPLVVPLLLDTLDMRLCGRVASHGSCPVKPITLVTRQLARSPRDTFYLDLVVFPLGPRKPSATTPSHFFVEEVDAGMTASCPMPGLGSSYLHHVKELYGVELTDPEQPMLRIASAKRQDLMLQVRKVARWSHHWCAGGWGAGGRHQAQNQS